MSISSVGSPPILQWLQSYLSGANASTGKQSCGGCQASSDTASISQEAAALNASQPSQPSDPSQTSGINGTQGHHRHHHHGGGHDGPSFMDQLAHSIVSDLQQATGTGASSSAGAAPSDAGTSSTSGGSFIDKLASRIADDLLAKYQQATGATTSPSPATTSQVHTIA